MINRDHTAVVLGLFETGLGVGRSLGRKGISVFGFDYKKDLGFYSKYIKAQYCPHPLNEEAKFVEFLIKFSNNFKKKPVIFITSDNFLLSVSRNRDLLKGHFLLNIPEKNLIESINDKYKQYLLAQKAKINVPKTYAPKTLNEVLSLKNRLNYPVFIKARDVNSWRKNVHGSLKGFVANDKNELIERYKYIFNKGTETIVQEVVPGKDTNHYKVCVYISQTGEFLLTFTLRKIRQDPIRFGVGSVVESIDYPLLMETGKRFFQKINYRGVGSAEFKLDEQDGRLKLIELNPRYWQQNALAEKCGMNFPLMNYLDLTGQNPAPCFEFKKGIKWVNIYMDFASFLAYRKAGEISLIGWLKSLKGKKIFSDYSMDDIKPGLSELGFGKKLINIPKYFLKRI